MSDAPTAIHSAVPIANKKQAVAIGGDDAGGGDAGVSQAEEDALQERLNRLRNP